VTVRRFAVVGDPVSHSKSPVMQGAAMRALLASTTEYLRRRGLEVAPQTEAAAEAFGLASASVSEDRPETPEVTQTHPPQDAVA